MSSFSDSVDATGTYAFGVCGVKTFTLDVGSPSFLSVTPGTDPINDDMTIAINTGLVTSAHAQTHTISYTVAF